MKKTKITFALIALITFNSFGQTIIPDNTNISGNWILANSPYIIEGRAIIPNGQTLTIEPGVEVRLKSSTSPTPSWFDYSAGNVGVIRVQGEIIANGTIAEPIVFTRNSTGFWGTILIDENASSNSSFSNCIVEYAKETRHVPGIPSVISFAGGISIFKTSISFNNNQLRNNNINGLYIKGVNTLFEFANNTIFANGTNGVVINESIVHCINNTFYNNSNNATGHVSAISSSNSTVFFVGNLIYNNQGFGIFTTNGGNNYIVNNTIFGNFNGIRVENGANTFIHNSIIQNNTSNFVTSSPGGATIEMQYSLTNSASFPVNVTNVAGNILNSNAMFTNTTINDFSLQSTSLCIDAGNPDTTGLNIPILDILGNDRIDNGIIDMGAIEFQQPIITYTVTTSSSPVTGGSTTGDGNYASGSNVTVTATSNPNYDFVNWTEGATVVSTDSAYNFNITGNRNLVANFILQSFDISASVSPANSGHITGAGSYNYNSTCTIVATPETGYDFVNWTENGIEVSTSATYSFIVTTDRTLVANFILQSFDISASVSPANSGHITGAGSYDYNSTCTIVATPETGYDFVNWTENGIEVSTSATYSFTVTAHRTLVANFESTTSINQPIFDNQEIVLFPNPTSDYINIDYINFKSANLFSLDGKFINKYLTQLINLSDINEGIYLLIIENTDGKKIVRKVIKK